MMRSILEAVAQCEESGGCFVVAGAGRRPEEAAGAANDDLLTLFEAYPEFLAALLDRVLASLAGPKATQRELMLRVACVPTPNDRGGTRALRRSNVRSILAEVERRLAEHGLATPTVRVLSPQPYNKAGEALVPGLVLADFVANSLAWRLSQNVDWKQMRAVARRDTGLSCSRKVDWASGATWLPTMAWRGAPADAIFEAWRGNPPASNLRRVRPRWAVDQARQWVDAISKRPSTGQGGTP